MPPAVARLQRVRVFEESTFAADLSASIGSFVDVRGIAPLDSQLPPNMLKDDSLRQRPWQDRKDFFGPRGRGKVAIKCYLMPSGVQLNAGASAPATPRTATGRILKRAFCEGWVSDKGDTAAAGSTTTVANWTTASRTAPGRAASYPTGTAGAYEMRVASSISVNNVTLKIATSNALSNGAAIVNTETFYPGAPVILGGLQFVLESPNRKAIVWLRGAQLVGGFSLDLPQKGLPLLTLNIESAGWYRDHEVASPISGSAIAAATYTDGDPQPFVKSEFLWGNAGSAIARQTLDTYEVKFTPSWGCEEVPAVDGENGIRGFYPTKPEPLGTLMFKTRVDDSAPYDVSFFDDWKAGTLKQAFIQIGNTAGNMYGIDLPNLQITDVQEISQAGILRGWQVTAKVLEDANATDQTTDLRRAPWRLHQS